MRTVSLPQAIPPRGYHFRDVQLEMSLKAFWDTSHETRDAVIREIFAQWQPLTRFAESISLMLWIGDGSEILEYTGDQRASFDWARYHGGANPIAWHVAGDRKDSGDPDHAAIAFEACLRDPEKRGVHSRSYLYRPEPAVFTYTWLAGLVAAIKRIGTELTGQRIQVGTTFDIGPEFAISKFKYEWHPEICGGGSLFGGKFIRCDARLHADTRVYAGYPGGIPEGTSVGSFLGRQCHHFFADHDFDFFWLSNGFGFAFEPWALTGAIFDGANFDASRAGSTYQSVLEFWRDLRNEFPNTPIRTRGTNLATGIDLGSDASPVREIYQSIPHVEPPVNSPWAALDEDIGLELAGWMSHIATTPGKGYRFRFYTHDAWWMNSPWLDRFQRQPFDIYLPLSVSRLERDGRVEPPSDVAFLSVDDSHGCLPPVVPVEVTAHILHAREFLPDAPGLIVWAYPFDGYHDLLLAKNPRPDLPFFGDWFVRGLISRSLPINTVASWENLLPLLSSQPETFHDSILLAPCLDDESAAPFLRYAQAGGTVLLYGPLDDCPQIRAALELGIAGPLEGDFLPEWDEERIIRHTSFLSAGGWSETPGPETRFSARNSGGVRAAGALRTFTSGGRMAWVRGSLATKELDPENPLPIKGPRLKELDRLTHFSSEDIARKLLADLGVGISFDVARPAPLLTIHRHENAFVFSGLQQGGNTPMSISLPAGAPVFPAYDNDVEGSTLHFDGPPSWHHVCRVFVTQEERGRVTCRILPPIQHGYHHRLLVSGLKNATVQFFPEPGTEDMLEILKKPLFPYFVGEFIKAGVIASSGGASVKVGNIDGELLFSW